MVMLMVPMVLMAAMTSSAFEDSGQRNDVNNAKAIKSYSEAMEVLQRYGYLGCRPPSRSVRRRPLSVCSPSDIRAAVRLYQKRFRLRPTGKLTSETLAMMSRSRCGNADVGEASEMSPVKISSLLPPDASDHARHKRQVPRLRKARNVHRFSRLQESAEESSDNSTERRVRWIHDRIQNIQTGIHDRKLAEVQRDVLSRRRRRSADMLEGFAQDVITWRLLSSEDSEQFSRTTQRAALGLSFRMWSEVIPPIFAEDSHSHINDVDILIAFGKGSHLNCPNKFDGLGGQLSHVLKQDTAEIHMDDDEQFTIGSEDGTNLVKVTVHEVGHVLGLHHVKQNQSIMYAIYSQVTPVSNFELRSEDRKMIQKIYGVCKGGFDVVFDWLRKRPTGQYIFNTFFFRSQNNWMYENRFNRTRFGDPLLIDEEWEGLPDNIDGFAHIWTHTLDRSLFFKDHQFWQYDAVADRVVKGYPKAISDNFKAKPHSSYPNIPGNLDSVFFDKRDGNLYFFKDNLVYSYETAKGRKGCCLKGYPKTFREEFPTDGPSQPLEGNVDSVYYSYADRTVYILKGTQFWHNKAYNVYDKSRKNLLEGPFDIHEKWHDICDVEVPN